MEKKDQTRADVYALQLSSVINRAFESKEIDLDKIMAEGHFLDFVFALACTVPCDFYSQMTDDKKDIIEFNHLANFLCFQNLKFSTEFITCTNSASQKANTGPRGFEPDPESDSHVS